MALLKRKRIGLNDAMSVVTRFVNACNRHDSDGVAACLHPDFDSIQPMYPSRNFRGADQVRRNWQAIFDAEPGFRLTVLRSAAMDDTVWLELHGAGRDAEVAGVFVMGIQGDRIRWARIYSALIEPVAAGMEEQAPPAPLHEVPPLEASPTEGSSVDSSPAAGNGEVVDEALIAPVLDIEGGSGRRRRRRRGEDSAAATSPPEGDAESTPAEPAPAPEPDPQPEATAEPDPVEPVAEVPVEPVVVVETFAVAPVVLEPFVVKVTEPEGSVEPDEIPAVDVESEEAAATVAGDDVRHNEDVRDDDGPPTQAVEMLSLTEPDSVPEPESEPEPPPPPPPVARTPPPEPPKRRFGKRSRF
jgi:limonene-1,2-epoxide hydrolase